MLVKDTAIVLALAIIAGVVAVAGTGARVTVAVGATIVEATLATMETGIAVLPTVAVGGGDRVGTVVVGAFVGAIDGTAVLVAVLVAFACGAPTRSERT